MEQKDDFCEMKKLLSFESSIIPVFLKFYFFAKKVLDWSDYSKSFMQI